LDNRGFGFIKPEEGGKDVFLHYSEIEDSYLINEGVEVEFEVRDTYKGLRAVNAKILG
jgi:CspA family cold shock protein